MVQSNPIAPSPSAFLTAWHPDEPVHFFAPSALRRRATEFLTGFPGLTTYAVKANPDPAVLMQLLAAGLTAFDVASPREISDIRRLAPDAALHYNNPIRSKTEIQFALAQNVRSFACDNIRELAKLLDQANADELEISVRFKLPVDKAAYHFGDKFGASPEEAVALLTAVKDAGAKPSLTFHPGTQCNSPDAYAEYIRAAADIARQANLTLHRLNVGGGYPSNRAGDAMPLAAFFDAIQSTTRTAFGAEAPDLICEPGRAMVADAFALAVRVKGLRDEDAVYLNDGIYGGLSEFPVLNLSAYWVFGSDGSEKCDRSTNRTLFGPTCDSLDTLPGSTALPADIDEDDYILFSAMGAYVTGVSTDFNGYGTRQTVIVKTL